MKQLCTDKETIAAQAHTIKQLQEFVTLLPSWDDVKELETKIKRLEDTFLD